MLTWMQHHKKYLVVTIWVSVIAFVGAGFVGWGAYDMNVNRTSSVALIGDEKVSFSEFSSRYNQIFSTYNEISNGTLSPENAKEMGLENMALASLIEDKLLLNYAKSLGLSASDDEVLQELSQTRAFFGLNNAFDKNVYYELLNRNNINAKDYEQGLRDAIVLTKLGKLFNFVNSQNDLQMLASSFFMQDNLSLGVLNENLQNIKVDEEALKSLWNERKNEYKTIKTYDISSFFVKFDEKIDEAELEKFYNEAENKFKYKDFAGKILSFEAAKEDVKKDFTLEKSRVLANEKFLALRDKKIEFENNSSIDEAALNYPQELLARAKPMDILRPFVYKKDNVDGYLIIRLDKINPVRIKSYEEARSEVLPQYKAEISRKNLEAKAKESLVNFKGKNIGFVSRDSLKNSDLNEFSDVEFSQVLMSVFNNEQNSSYVLLNDEKIALYKIEAQKLNANEENFKQYQTMLNQNLNVIKANAVRKELVDELKKKYAVKIYYKGN